jgi:hypothetical protein
LQDDQPLLPFAGRTQELTVINSRQFNDRRTP